MKVKYLGILLFAILAFYGCDDNTGTLGMSMLPDSDGISATTTTFDVTTKSLLAEKVYAKTSTGYVGKFTDPAPEGFGSYEASFLTELNCTDDFKFPAVYDPEKHVGTMAGDTVVSAQLTIYYSSWFGDSLNPCRMSVYELDKRLENKHYTDINPKEYYGNETDKPHFEETGYFELHKAYTAYDTSVPDSVRNATDSNGNSLFYPNVTLNLMRDTRLRIEIRVFIMILYLMASTLFWLRINYLMRKNLMLIVIFLLVQICVLQISVVVQVISSRNLFLILVMRVIRNMIGVVTYILIYRICVWRIFI